MEEQIPFKRKKSAKAGIVLIFAVVLIAMAVFGLMYRKTQKAENPSHDSLQAMGAAFDSALFIPMIAGELGLCKALFYYLTCGKRSRRRNALNAAILALSAAMIVLPILLLTDHYFTLSGAAVNRLDSVVLMIQIVLPFVLMPVILIISAIDTKNSINA